MIVRDLNEADEGCRYYIRSVKYLEPQSPEVCDLVARKYKNRKKRATFIRHPFAIVAMARDSSKNTGSETNEGL
jgi:hypothetical protein